MEQLRDSDQKVLQDYQKRLSQLSEQPQASLVNNSLQQQFKQRYSSNLDNNGKPSYYQQQYKQEQDNLQKENRSNSVNLTQSNSDLNYINNTGQYLINNQKREPLDGLSPNDYVNNRIQKQLELRRDYQEYENSQSQKKSNQKQQSQFIQQGRFKVPLVSLFSQNVDGNLPKNIDLVNKSSDCLYKQEQNDYDIHLNSFQLSQKLNILIQRGHLEEKKREEKIQLLENILQSNAQLEHQEIVKLLDQVQDNNQNQTIQKQFNNNNDNDLQIAQGLMSNMHLSHINNQSQQMDHSGITGYQDIDYQTSKVQDKKSTKDKKLNSKDSLSKLGSSLKIKSNEKLKQQKQKKGTLSTIQESQVSSKQSIKSIKKEPQSNISKQSKVLKDSTQKINQVTKKQVSNNQIAGSSHVQFEKQEENAENKQEKSQAQIIQESEGFQAVMKSEQASHNNQALEFIKQQFIKNNEFRNSALYFVKQYVSNK